MQANLSKAADKLIELIEGRYNEFSGSRWGMGEYDNFERKYLSSLSEENKVSVFRAAYEGLGSDKLPESIKQIFYLASVYRVKFSKEYLDILRSEKLENKKEIFFEKARYYIEDRWSESAKKSLSDDDKNLIKVLCLKYNKPLPFA
jgi:hypothetical protein